MSRKQHQVREIGTRSGRYSCIDCHAVFESWEAADAHQLHPEQTPQFKPTLDWEADVVEELNRYSTSAAKQDGREVESVDGWHFYYDHPGIMTWHHADLSDGHLAASWNWSDDGMIPADWMAADGMVITFDDVPLEATGDATKDAAAYIEAIRPRLATVFAEMADRKAAQALIKSAGFDETSTGGGCTALHKESHSGTYILITAENDPVAPWLLDQACIVGQYDKAGDIVMDTVTPTLALALEMAAKFDAYQP